MSRNITFEYHGSSFNLKLSFAKNENKLNLEIGDHEFSCFFESCIAIGKFQPKDLHRALIMAFTGNSLASFEFIDQFLFVYLTMGSLITPIQFPLTRGLVPLAITLPKIQYTTVENNSCLYDKVAKDSKILVEITFSEENKYENKYVVWSRFGKGKFIKHFLPPANKFIIQNHTDLGPQKLLLFFGPNTNTNLVKKCKIIEF